MKDTTKYLLYALVPGRRRLAARLGVEPVFVSFMAVLGMQVICTAVIRRLHGRTSHG